MLLLLGLLSAAAESDRIYFYENFCESCDPVQEFAETFERLTGQAASEDSFESWNTIRSAGMV